jgi:hypothetical protein
MVRKGVAMKIVLWLLQAIVHIVLFILRAIIGAAKIFLIMLCMVVRLVSAMVRAATP